MASGIIPQRITELRSYSVDSYIEAGDNNASVTANPPDGFKFLCWTSCATVGFIGAPYMDTPSSATTKIWTSIEPSARKSVRGNYICYR